MASIRELLTSARAQDDEPRVRAGRGLRVLHRLGPHADADQVAAIVGVQLAFGLTAGWATSSPARPLPAGSRPRSTSCMCTEPACCTASGAAANGVGGAPLPADRSRIGRARVGCPQQLRRGGCTATPVPCRGSRPVTLGPSRVDTATAAAPAAHHHHRIPAGSTVSSTSSGPSAAGETRNHSRRPITGRVLPSPAVVLEPSRHTNSSPTGQSDSAEHGPASRSTDLSERVRETSTPAPTWGAVQTGWSATGPAGAKAARAGQAAMGRVAAAQVVGRAKGSSSDLRLRRDGAR